MITHPKVNKELTGVRVGRDAPIVTHLLFADDSLILMEANEKNAMMLKKIMDMYCDSSGQMVSDAKSSTPYLLQPKYAC
jgi:hypothetical protein